VYVIPALGVVLAAGGIAVATGRWRRRAAAPEPAAPSSAAGSRLDDDLDRYDL
jgi:hypothetical protein